MLIVIYLKSSQYKRKPLPQKSNSTNAELISVFIQIQTINYVLIKVNIIFNIFVNRFHNNLLMLKIDILYWIGGCLFAYSKLKPNFFCQHFLLKAFSKHH